jgi:hypothetical protein
VRRFAVCRQRWSDWTLHRQPRPARKFVVSTGSTARPEPAGGDPATKDYAQFLDEPRGSSRGSVTSRARKPGYPDIRARGYMNSAAPVRASLLPFTVCRIETSSDSNRGQRRRAAHRRSCRSRRSQGGYALISWIPAP